MVSNVLAMIDDNHYDPEYFVEKYQIHFDGELPLNHEPSLRHWVEIIAEGEMEDGGTDWDYEYERAWHSLDAEYNYSYV